MRRNARRRPTGARRATFASVALIMGGGGLVAANFYASAHESNDSGQNRTKSAAAQIATIKCPDVGQQLADVPDKARAGVDMELANLDKQVNEAYARLTSTRKAQAGDTSFVQNAILGPLKDKRTAVIDRIRMGIERVGGTFDDSLKELANCTAVAADQVQADAGQNNGDQQPGGEQGQNDNGGQPNIGGQVGNGPVADDFVDITKVQPNVQSAPRANGSASTGTFSVSCGVNENNNFNTDNLIVAPGVNNGARHTHDYVGNQDVNAFSKDQDLANAATTCSEKGDKSAYYWPVLRLQDGTKEFDDNKLGGGAEGNAGRILKARTAEITYVGSPTSKVVAMPKFLRIITGDAKAFSNGTANANAHWSCTGFEDKVQLTDKYPLCPQGSGVVRSFAFQSCWDGRNIDSANHRSHVAFADAEGNCQNGFKAIPQLTMRLVYDVPTPTIENGQVKNPFAVDGFQTELHKAITDHDDFISVMDGNLMNKVVDCINGGRQCGTGAAEQPQDKPTATVDAGAGSGNGKGGMNHDTSGNMNPPQATPSTRAAEPAREGPTTDHSAAPEADKASSPAGEVDKAPLSAEQKDSTPSPAEYQDEAPLSAEYQDEAPLSAEHQDEAPSSAEHQDEAPSSAEQKDKAPSSAEYQDEAPSSADQGEEPTEASRNGSDDSQVTGAADPEASPVASPAGGGAPSTEPQTETQTVAGDLAETGTTLWPAMIGGALMLAGAVLLLAKRRRRSV
ncbi:DUF1996 domain-containing protein [Streptomyces sp. HNM0663]|uniref:DUF1996 domain-containing protein n=1 Tax=Streptomyces chengmaiensis TaxID=3040919 RepID=A0ABT6HRC9_9ACTN|nr:DUF1996 domain-containing protein [Streptomyces chengmaiensis]MDH2390594.1 DUF1996 domain-containing protein [Streptomyces chengmaiensis]